MQLVLLKVRNVLNYRIIKFFCGMLPCVLIHNFNLVVLL